MCRERVVQCVEGFLVQFVVMRLPLTSSVIWSGLRGNSMGLILDARNVSFQDPRVAVFWLWSSGWVGGEAARAWSNKPDSSCQQFR